MGQYLIDNNVISNYFFNFFSERVMSFISNVIDQIPNISVITEIEALSWQAPDIIYEEIIKEFIDNSNVLPLSKKIVTQCIQIRRNKKVKTPDAIIAATAIVHNLTLITNDNDFKNIQQLQILNPNDID
jgi:predicted nucleic acid-binding protein